METRTINMDNWSGKKTTLTIKEDGHFELSHMGGHDFWLERKPDFEDEYLVKYYYIMGKGFFDKLGEVHQTRNERHYTAFGTEIDRYADCPYEAAAKLICMTV